MKNLFKYFLFFSMFFATSSHAVVTVTHNADGTRSLNFPSNTMGGSSSTYNVAPNGTTKLTPVTPISTNPNYGGFTYEPAPTGGGVKATGTFNLPIGNTGAAMPVDVASHISKTALALAVGRIIGGPGGTVAAIAIPPLVDWLKRNNIEPASDGSGFTQPSPGACTLEPCYGWTDSGWANPVTVFPVFLDACRRIATLRGYDPSTVFDSSPAEFPLTSCRYPVGTSGSFQELYPPQVNRPADINPPRVPLSPADIQNALGQPGSAAPTPDIVPGLLGGGQDLPVSASPGSANPSPITVTGAATVPGTTSTTSSPASGTTPASSTTTSTVYNNTYVDNTVTTTITTTNTTTVSGQPSTTTTTTTPAPVPVIVGVPDPCVTDPQRVGCLDAGDAHDGVKMPNLDIPVSITPISFASPASCPPPLSGSINVGSFVKTWTFNYDPMCDLMTMLRPLFLSVGAAAAAWLFMEGLKS